MKKQILNKIIFAVSLYYEIDLFQVIGTSQLILFIIKIHLNKPKS